MDFVDVKESGVRSQESSRLAPPAPNTLPTRTRRISAPCGSPCAHTTTRRPHWPPSPSGFGGYALRWDGISWSVARRWRQGAEATSVTAISPTDVWLFGAPGHGQQGAGTWHFDGHSWIRIT